MKFATEEELLAAFLEFIEQTKPRKYCVIREFDGGLGLADVVFYRQAPKSDQALKFLKEVSPRLAVFMDDSVAGKVRSVDDFKFLAGTGARGAREVSNHLTRMGLLKRRGAHGFSLRGFKKPSFGSVIAIEAKLSDWRRGLTQAFRYSQFSNQSWVLLDHGALGRSIANIHLFEKAGIGLASFSTCGKLFVHVPARDQEPTSLSKLWRAQAILARHQTDLNRSALSNL